MSVNDGLITAPVSILEVGSLHGHIMDLGQLCLYGGINTWALYKPVKHTNTGILSESEKKGFNGQCGISIPWSSLDSCSEYIRNVIASKVGYLGWYYDPPTGGNYPFRLLDFENYNKNALNPFMGVSSPVTGDNLGMILITVGFNLQAWNTPYNITPDKLVINNSPCANWYAGVIAVLYKSNDYTIQALVTDSVTLANTELWHPFDFDGRAMNKGNYYLIPVICSSDRSGNKAYYKASNMPLPVNDIVAFLPIMFDHLNIHEGSGYIYPKVIVKSVFDITVQLFATKNGGSYIKSPTITLTIEYATRAANSTYTTCFKKENYTMESVFIDGNAKDYELIGEHFTIPLSSLSSVPTVANMRITINGVNPTYLKTTVLSFPRYRGTYTDYAIK